MCGPYRLDYLEKSRKFEDRLKELKSEIHALKLEEKQSGLYSRWNEVLGSLDRSLGNVCALNTCHFPQGTIKGNSVGLPEVTTVFQSKPSLPLIVKYEKCEHRFGLVLVFFTLILLV